MSKFLGILDWGVGGLGLYNTIKQRADIPVLYFSDAGHLPYGQTPARQLNKRLHNILEHMRSLGASHVAIACNAASAAYPDTKTVNGIVSHGLTVLNNLGPEIKKVGLLAGRGTVYSRIFPNRLGPRNYHLRQRVSQPLSAHVEAGRLTGAALHTDLKSIMSPLKNSDAILLACTHYPAIQEQVAKYVNKDCQMLDPADQMAEWILKNWQLQEAKTKDRWITSGPRAQLINNGKAAFGVNISNVEQATI